MARLRRFGGARFAALHACPWLTYGAPSALRGDAFRCASRLPLAYIWRAFGAQGRRVPLRFTLAPGLHMARLRRSGATRSAALHACPWLTYGAPSALRGDAFRCASRLPLAYIWRAFGAEGRRVPLRFTLAPGLHDAFRCASRLPLAYMTHSAALHACPWLTYGAPSALGGDALPYAAFVQSLESP